MAMAGMVLFGAAGALAASVEWTGTTSNQWSDATNWSGGTPAGNIVHIRSGSNQPVELSSEDSVESIQLGSGSGTSGSLSILPGAKLTTTGPSSRLGNGGTGLITQTGGEVIFGQHLTIADYGPGSGTYDLQAGSVSVNAGYFTVGMRGAGYFDISSTATLTVNTGFYVGSSHVDNGGSGTFTQDGGTVSANGGLTLGQRAGTGGIYHLNSGTLNVTGNIVNGAGSGTMNIDGGVLNLLTSSAAAGFDTLRLGNAGSTTGSLTVTGSQAFTIADLIVGNEGAGAITQNSGTVTATTLSLASQSGSSGAYTLNGGTLTVTGDITDGAGASKLTIDGGTLVLGGSAITVDTLWIGDLAGRTGSLSLSGTETVTVTGLEVGERSGSTGLLNIGDDASLIVNGWSRLGNGGSATVEQTGGEVRFNGGFALADGSGAGTYRISDGELFVTSLTIGMRSAGILEVSGNAVVETTTLYVGSRTDDNYGAVGTVTQTGGLVKATNTGIVLAKNAGGTGIYNLQGGVLQATTIDPGLGTGEFHFTGGTLQAGTVNIPLVQEGGILSPGASVGATTINGDYTLSAGTLQIELDALGSSDLLTVNGGVNLTGGSLELLLGYEPSLGDSFTILVNDEADAINGVFAGLSQGAKVLGSFGGEDYSFRIAYNGGTGNDVVLVGVPEPTGLTLGLLGLLACLVCRTSRYSCW